MQFNKSKKTLVALAIAGVVVAGSGAAYAYWSTTGSGTGTVSAASAQTPVTVTQSNTISNLAPGVAAQVLSGTFGNSNNYKVQVHQVAVTIESVTLANGVSGTCDASDFTLASTPMAVDQELAANSVSTGNWTGATIVFNDKTAANQDACKGATVHLAYTVS